MFEVLSKISEVNWLLLKELNPGGTYSVSMRGTSLHFLSNYTEPSLVTLTSDILFNKSAVFCEDTASFLPRFTPLILKRFVQRMIRAVMVMETGSLKYRDLLTGCPDRSWREWSCCVCGVFVLKKVSKDQGDQ